MSGILTIADSNGTDLNMFDNYGRIIASDITVHATIYLNEYTRKTKNNDKLYHCLNNSLTASGTAKIIAKSTKYHIGNNHCGVLIFKLLL